MIAGGNPILCKLVRESEPEVWIVPKTLFLWSSQDCFLSKVAFLWKNGLHKDPGATIC